MAGKDKQKEFFEHSYIFISGVMSGDFEQEDCYEITLEILKIDGGKLASIEPERFSPDQYLNLCLAAIGQNPLSLEWVKEAGIGAENYVRLCHQAVKKDGTSLYFVKRDLFANDQTKLQELYHAAVSQNTDALMFIQDQTLPLCLMAVKRNASALQWVNPKLFSKEAYGEICLLAFYQKQEFILLERIFGSYFDIKYIKNYQALRFVKKDHLLPETYKKICKAAVEYSAQSLPFADGDML